MRRIRGGRLVLAVCCALAALLCAAGAENAFSVSLPEARTIRTVPSTRISKTMIPPATAMDVIFLLFMFSTLSTLFYNVLSDPASISRPRAGMKKPLRRETGTAGIP